MRLVKGQFDGKLLVELWAVILLTTIERSRKMSKDKYYGNDKQIGKYTFHDKDKATGKHENSYYIPGTGVTGYHGENTDKGGKSSLGELTRNSSMFDVNPGKK